MAPEQLEGRDVDHRADQFAFGVLRLRDARRPAAVQRRDDRRIVGLDPARRTALISQRCVPDVPVPLARIVTRCLAKDPERRYASTTDLAHAISDVSADLALLTPPSPVECARRVAARSPGCAALAAVIDRCGDRHAAASARTRRPRRRRSSGDACGRGAAVHDDRRRRMPISPMASPRRSRANSGHIEGTRVIAASSAFAYRGRTEDAERIGRELGVERAWCAARCSAAGERVRISAALIDGRDNTTLWSNHYDRGDGRYSVRSRTTSRGRWRPSWRRRLGAPPPPRPAETPTDDAGRLRRVPPRHQPHARHVVSLRRRHRRARTAVALDPNFALARARLASAYTQQFFYNATDPELERKAFVEIEKALAINPDLAEAYWRARS